MRGSAYGIEQCSRRITPDLQIGYDAERTTGPLISRPGVLAVPADRINYPAMFGRESTARRIDSAVEGRLAAAGAPALLLHYLSAGTRNYTIVERWLTTGDVVDLGADPHSLSAPAPRTYARFEVAPLMYAGSNALVSATCLALLAPALLCTLTMVVMLIVGSIQK